MAYAECSDARLVELARAGVAGAFGVLVHRYGPLVLRLADDDPDPVGATAAVFVRAMRELRPAPIVDVEDWLLGIATEELDVPSGHADAARAEHGTATPPADTATAVEITAVLDPRLDDVWSELSRRWPDGRRARHVPSWVIWTLTGIILIALAVLLPWAVLGAPGEQDPVDDELHGSPLPDEPEPSESDQVDDTDTAEEQLPSFELPSPEQPTSASSPTGSGTGAETSQPAGGTLARDDAGSDGEALPDDTGSSDTGPDTGSDDGSDDVAGSDADSSTAADDSEPDTGDALRGTDGGQDASGEQDDDSSQPGTPAPGQTDDDPIEDRVTRDDGGGDDTQVVRDEEQLDTAAGPDATGG